MINIDPPYRLKDNDLEAVLIGWCATDHPVPPIAVEIDHCPVPFSTPERPDVKKVFPNLNSIGLLVPIDFKRHYTGRAFEFAARRFLVNVRVRCGDEQRNFEYEVTPKWLEKVFPGTQQPPRAKPVPPDHLQIRVTGAAAGEFYATGQVVASQIARLLVQAGIRVQDCHRVLDFGCGCGRVISAFRDLHPTAELHGSDIDAEAIDWCARSLSDIGNFQVNGHLPPTSFPDNHFNLIYSISIFTHLPEDMQFAWLAELRRILKPGGILLTTVIGPYSYRTHLPSAVQKDIDREGFLYADQPRPGWPEYLGQKTAGLPDFYKIAYHTHDYVRAKWSRYFEVLDLREGGLNNTQDAVLCRKV